MYELPPILQGDEQQQLKALRDYLVRMARDLDTNIIKTVETTAETSVSRALSGGVDKAVGDEIQNRAAQLRSLIVKTADQIHHEIDVITEELHEDYLAISDFGTYQEQILTTIETTARNIVESYDYQAAINALGDQVGENESYLTAIRGEIRRGLITDPETGETAMGIAISEELSFTGNTQTEGGLVYYELSPGQTIGLYTATGWQFWINGSKRGWFDSRDGMLHVANLAVENSLNLGAGWVITTTGGFGLRYTGG